MPQERSRRAHNDGVVAKVHQCDNSDTEGPYGLEFNNQTWPKVDETFMSVEQAQAAADMRRIDFRSSLRQILLSVD